MLSLFSSREIAIGFYLFLIGVWIMAQEKTRNGAIQVLKAACNRKLAVPFVLLLLYACALVLGVSHFWFWKCYYIKDIVVWVLFVGVPLCYKAIDHKNGHYFRDSVFSNLRFTALVEFLSGTFTFSLIAELIIQPVVAFLFLLQEVSKRDEKYSSVAKLISSILSVGGLWLLYATLKKAIEEYSQLNTTDLLVSFCIPLLFSLLYLPAALFLALYAKYEIIFKRISFCTKNNKSICRRQKWAVFRACGLSYNNVCRFEQNYLYHLYKQMSAEELSALISAFKRNDPVS